MQCEGITRSGKRCRNKALDDEIFCEIHMRVNRTYSLALLVPFLTTVLLVYFFFFGIYFDTLIFGIFDLNYFNYAGISDFFISMFRSGGLLTVVVLKLWFLYAVIVAIIFCIWLLVWMIILTSRQHLKIGYRLKIVGLSVGVFILNFLHMFVILFPKRSRKHPSSLLIGREHLVRSIIKHKKASDSKTPGHPLLTSGQFYQRYFMVVTFNNHRFFMTILLMAMTSFAAVLYAGHEAKKMRNCIIEVANGKISTSASTSTLYPGLNISSMCRNGLAELPEDLNIADKFSDSLRNFFTFPVVILNTKPTATPVLYLGSTGRFEMFFNGSTRLPFAVPNQDLGPLINGSTAAAGPDIANLDEKITLLAQTVQQTNDKLVSLTKSTTARGAIDTSSLTRKLEDLEKSTERSGGDLQILQQGLERVADELQAVEHDHTKRIVATIPAYCWEIDPHLVIEFNIGSTQVTETSTIDLIKKLAYEYSEAESQFIVVSGYSDPSGSSFDNYRLSRRRAEAVMALMSEAGINQSAAYMIGRGEDNSKSLPRRRVEIRDCTVRKETG
ncbi:MAG: hypothetical protein COB93_10205 [Sneathiella sp.]|nr:MAG: hypothetical protein COB93_10205 [Sneathiella sp.]